MTQPGTSVVPPSHSWGGFFPPIARVQLVLIAVLLMMVYWTPIQRDLVWRWLNDGNWSHGWLVPVFSLYFLTTRRDELFRIRPKVNYLGAVILALSLLVYFIGVWRLRMSYPQGLSLVGAIFGLALLFGGWRMMRIAWFPIAYLILAVPLPETIYRQLTMPLRQIATSVAAAIMPLFAPGLHTKAQSVVIDFMFRGTSGTLDIEEACSGLRLMVAFVALGVAMAYLGRRPNWQRIVMVISCLPISIFCNTIRVTVTGLLRVYGHSELAQGTPHQLLGILMLVIAFGLYAIIGYILANLVLDEVQADEDAEGPAPEQAL